MSVRVCVYVRFSLCALLRVRGRLFVCVCLYACIYIMFMFTCECE